MKNNFRVGNNKRPGSAWLITLMLLFIATGALAAPQYSFTCVSCHGTPPNDSTTRDVNSGNFVGNHATHSTANILSCNKCHTGPTTSTPADMSHKNGQISLNANINSSIQGSARYAGIATFKNQTSIPVLGTCTNVNCHFESTTVAWGLTTTWGSTKVANDNSVNCAQCHQSTGLTTGAHALHISDLGGTLTACNSCHNNYNSAAGTAAFLHATSAATAIVPKMTPGTYAGGRTASNYLPSRATAATGTCSATNCHGSGAPAWNATAAVPVNTFPYSAVQCTKCHGSTTAPFYSTAIPKVTVNTDAKVGAHAAHLTGSSNISSAIACNECHVVPAAVNAAGHMNGTSLISFTGPIATANSTAPTGTLTTCGTTWCHGAAGVKAEIPQNSPARINPAWSTPFVTGSVLGTGGTAGTSGTGYCANCHGYPPRSVDHAGVTVSQCNGCHNHLNTDGLTFNNKALHINGVIDQQGCSGCHGWPPTTNAHTIHINNIISEKALGTLPSGFLNNQVCGVCHNVSATTKHAGTVGNDGTSRNIYLPAPYGNQTSYKFGPSANSYDKAATTTCSNISCHFGTSTAWGTPPTTTCQTCHGYPPVTVVDPLDNKHATGATAVNHIGTGATVNTKATFVSVHGGCQICHGTQSTVANGSGIQQPHANYVVATQHFTGNINMNGPTGTGTGYNSTNRGCDSACHANDATHRMTTSNKTLTFGNYGTGGDCISCHTTTQASPIAAAINGTVIQRPAIVPQFASTWSHKRSGAGAVVKEDCCVCHMEGDVATGSPNPTYHKNGYVELRDPDLGTTIKAVTHSGTATTAGAFVSTATDAKFVRFSRNLAITLEAETAAIPGVAGLTNFQVIGAIEANFCLKCHDANGATSALARVPTTGTAMRPFGTTITGHTAGQNTNGDGNVVNVALTLATTNASYHPVMGKQNNSYAQGAQMIAPWTAAKTNGNNTQYGALISCWDCHATLGQTGVMTSDGTTAATVTAHGATVTLRGPIRAAGTTATTNLCVNCHATKYSTVASNHGAGSAFTSGSGNMGTSTFNNCSYCHGYGVDSATYSAASVTRPRRAEEAHGFNDRVTGTIGSKWSGGNRPYAFIRNTLTNWSPKSATGDTIANPSTCTGTGGTCNNNMSNSSNGLGGVY